MIRIGSAATADLWRPIHRLARLRTALPSRLTATLFEGALPLHAAPLSRAVLAVGTDAGAYEVGEVAVMSPGGEWRVVDRRALGMRNPQIVEQQFELSPDGTSLALGDEGAIWVVDVTTAGAIRVPIDMRDPVLHGWFEGGVVFSGRGGIQQETQRTWLADPVERKARPLALDGWKSSIGTDGSAVEFMFGERSTTAPYQDDGLSRFQVWNQDDPGLRRSTDRIMLGPARVATRWQSLVAIAQSGDGSGSWPSDVAMGVSAFDPQSAETVAFLQLPKRQAMRAVPLGPIDDDWILLQIAYGPGGGIFAWNPERERLGGVTAINDEYPVLSVAYELVGGSR